VIWACWLWACGEPAAVPTTPQGPPRTPAEACARLQSHGATCSFEGGTLGDEVSLWCEGRWEGAAYTVSVVTTGLPLPAPSEGVGVHHGDVWVEASAGAHSQRLHDRFVGADRPVR
jgi:hypothetical protein